MKLSNSTKVLHSIIALSMIAVLILGIYIHETDTRSLIGLHKSLGVILLIIALGRVIVRIKEGWPKPISNTAKVQLVMAKIVHWFLLASTIIYPASGMVMSGAGGHGVAVFGLQIIAKHTDSITGKAVPVNESIGELAHGIHGLLTWVLVFIIILHVAGALKHHLIDKDDTIKRMFSLKG